jgi:hypothetical protein
VDHLPNGFLAAIGIDRCRDGCGPWPCAGHKARLCDTRDVAQEKADIEWQRQTLRQQDAARRQLATETGAPLNHGPRYSS